MKNRRQFLRSTSALITLPALESIGFKAFAATNLGAGSHQSQACGIAWGAGSKKQAEESAIKVCRSQKSGNCWVTRSE